jgi:hypothetical protein
MGSYSVVVNNAQGAVTSQTAFVTVLVPPSFLQLPAETTTVEEGETVTFQVTATGTPPLFYQWRKNGVNIPGATNDTLTITNVQVADGGSYSVVVANVVAAITSDAFLLIVRLRPVPPGDNFANRVSITGLTDQISGDNRSATRETGEPRHAGKNGSNSVWYT